MHALAAVVPACAECSAEGCSSSLSEMWACLHALAAAPGAERSARGASPSVSKLSMRGGLGGWGACWGPAAKSVRRGRLGTCRAQVTCLSGWACMRHAGFHVLQDTRLPGLNGRVSKGRQKGRGNLQDAGSAHSFSMHSWHFAQSLTLAQHNFSLHLPGMWCYKFVSATHVSCRTPNRPPLWFCTHCPILRPIESHSTDHCESQAHL